MTRDGTDLGRGPVTSLLLFHSLSRVEPAEARKQEDRIWSGESSDVMVDV